MREGVGVSAWCGCAQLFNRKEAMKILPFIFTAAILAGTAMAEPAPAASVTQTEVVVTDDELDALTDYRKKHVVLTADELAFLTEYRKTEAARVEKDRPATGWALVKEWLWGAGIILVIPAILGLIGACSGLHERWQNWKYRRQQQREEAEYQTALEAAQRQEEANWTSATDEDPKQIKREGEEEGAND